MKEEYYWQTIDALTDIIARLKGGADVNGDSLKEAVLKLRMEQDKREVRNEPCDEVKRLIGVMEHIKYEVLA